MNKRPLILYLVPVLMLGVALSFPIQAALLYNHEFTELPGILSKMTLLNWLTMISILVSSYLIFQATSYAKYSISATIVLVFINNYFVGAWEQDYSQAQSHFASVGFTFLFFPLLHKSAMEVLKDPKKRWWARSQRHLAHIPITINPFVGQSLTASTFDISDTGVFVAVGNDDLMHLPKVGDKIRLSLTLNSMKKIKCEAKVVRIAKPNGMYPQGLGLEFIQLDSMNKTNLKRYLSHPVNHTL